MQNTSFTEQFIIQQATLQSVMLQGNGFEYIYLLDGEAHCLKISYNSVNFFADFPSVTKSELHTLAVVLGVLGFARFGAVLPQTLEVNEYEQQVPAFVYEFMQEVLPGVWSEHRYQLGATDFLFPTWNKRNQVADEIYYPIFSSETTKQPGDNIHKALLTSGAGKDSLLCACLLEQAGISYELVTLFFSLYGTFSDQQQMFQSVTDQNTQITLHQVYFEDEYYTWLEKRMQRMNIREILPDKPFRTESGETLLSSLAYVPVQLAHGCKIQVWGNEKSADLPNLTLPATGEGIAHQWSKSLKAEQAINRFLHQLFVGVHRSSLIKPLYDVRIFKTLFEIAGNLPYATNSCNIQKPWCGQCEKCAYVFLGFAAYGDFYKTVETFGTNLLEQVALNQVWEELLGLKENISWECVGSADEVRVYFYRIYQKRQLQDQAIRLFAQQILKPLRAEGLSEEEINLYFDELEQEYLQIHQQHHTMPDWLIKALPV